MTLMTEDEFKYHMCSEKNGIKDGWRIGYEIGKGSIKNPINGEKIYK